MRRRDLLLASGAFGTLAAAGVRAQPPKAPRLIGWLFPATREGDKSFVEAFTTRFRELGYIEGRDFVLENRQAEGRVARMPVLARELIALKPAVIVTGSSAAVAALKKETTSVPIVFGTAGDPVEQGLIASLSRPGGNITGVSLRSELYGKLAELMRETLPSGRRVVLLVHEGEAVAGRIIGRFEREFPSLGFQLSVVRVKGPEDFERAFAEMTRGKAEALVLPNLAQFFLHRGRIAELAAKARLPLFTTMRARTDRGPGGLLAYASDASENYRRAAVLVDKILKGAKPADLPVEEPERYVLTIDMRVAKTLGIVIPQSVLLRADEVIE